MEFGSALVNSTEYVAVPIAFLHRFSPQTQSQFRVSAYWLPMAAWELEWRNSQIIYHHRAWVKFSFRVTYWIERNKIIMWLPTMFLKFKFRTFTFIYKFFHKYNFNHSALCITQTLTIMVFLGIHSVSSYV